MRALTLCRKSRSKAASNPVTVRPRRWRRTLRPVASTTNTIPHRPARSTENTPARDGPPARPRQISRWNLSPSTDGKLFDHVRRHKAHWNSLTQAGVRAAHHLEIHPTQGRVKCLQAGPDMAAKKIVSPDRGVPCFRSEHPRFRGWINGSVQPFRKQDCCSRRNGDEARFAILGSVNVATINPLFDLNGARGDAEVPEFLLDAALQKLQVAR